MAKIAILNDSPEVVTLLAHFLTPGRHELLNRIGATPRMVEEVVAFGPAVVVVSLHRRPDTVNRPLADPETELVGLGMARLIGDEPRLAAVPLLLFGFYVTEAELPRDRLTPPRHHAFMTFPLGLQELNPLISGLVGPAQGSREDVERVRRF